VRCSLFGRHGWLMAASETIRREQFAELLRRNRSRLFGYIHAIVRNLADTDDVFQQTTLVLWRRFDAYDPSRSFLAWACGVARLEAATWLRKHARDRLRFSDDLTQLLIDAFAEIGDEEIGDRQAALPACLDKLDEPNRLLIAECYERGTDVAEIARRMGRSAPSVHNTLRRIRRMLFECIERRVARAARN
jgi:RNA polymerase sigma-70 factor, ECF subfamily